MTSVEYKLVAYRSKDEAQRSLNRLAQQGWRVVGFGVEREGWHFLLERPLEAVPS